MSGRRAPVRTGARTGARARILGLVWQCPLCSIYLAAPPGDFPVQCEQCGTSFDCLEPQPVMVVAPGRKPIVPPPGA